MRWSSGQIAFIGTWILLVAGTLLALHFESRLQFGQGETVAQLEASRGVVQFRPRNLPIWSYAADDQRFYEDNVIATGRSSAARIRFEDGRGLEVLPNSQVVISTRKAEDGDGEYVVTLLGGSLAASAVKPNNETKPAKKLVFKVKNKEVKITDTATRVRIKATSTTAPTVKVDAGRVEVKERGNKPSLALLAGQTLSIKSTDSVEFKPMVDSLAAKIKPPTAAQAVATTEPLPSPTPLPSSAPQLELTPSPRPVLAPPTPPHIVSPPKNATLWTPFAFADRKASYLPITLKPAGGTKSRGERYFIEAAGTPGRVFAAASDAKPDHQVVMLKPELLRQLSRREQDRGLPLLKLQLRAGSQNSAGKTTSRQAHQVQLGSLSEVKSRNIRLILKNLRQKNTRSVSWMMESPGLFIDQAAIVLDLQEGSQLIRLADFLAGSPFSIKTHGGLPTQGAFFVKDGEIIAVAAMKLDSTVAWEALRRALDADIIFHGSRAALIQGFGRASTDRRARLVTALQNEAVFLVQNRRAQRIDARLVKTNPSAIELIEEVAPALFREEVRVLAVR